jgi:hypothetical protein
MAKSTNWIRRLFTRAQPIDNVQVADASSHIHNLVPGGCLVQCGMGQLPFDDDPLIDIKLMPGFNWAPIQGMDGVQLGAALKSFKPSGKRGVRS